MRCQCTHVWCATSKWRTAVHTSATITVTPTPRSSISSAWSARRRLPTRNCSRNIVRCTRWKRPSRARIVSRNSSICTNLKPIVDRTKTRRRTTSRNGNVVIVEKCKWTRSPRECCPGDSCAFYFQTEESQQPHHAHENPQKWSAILLRGVRPEIRSENQSDQSREGAALCNQIALVSRMRQKVSAFGHSNPSIEDIASNTHFRIAFQFCWPVAVVAPSHLPHKRALVWVRSLQENV